MRNFLVSSTRYSKMLLSHAYDFLQDLKFVIVQKKIA